MRQFALDIVRYLYNSGDLDVARVFAERFIEQWSTDTDPSDLLLLRAQRHLGNALRDLGQYSAAYARDEETLGLVRESLGERDPLTLLLTNSFGADLRARGDFAGALELDNKSLELHKLILGAEDPQSLRVMNNLAVDYGLNSRYPEARDLHRDTYRLRSKALTEIPATEMLSSWNGLARALRLCGNYAEARDVGHDAYDYGLSELEPEHPRTLETAIDLSIALRRIAVSYGEALEMARTVFEQSTRRFGLGTVDLGRHGQLPLIFSGLAARLTNALTKDTVDQYLKIYGPDHPYYHGCMGNLALLYRVNNDPSRARALNEQALTGLEAKLGRDHHYPLLQSP